MPAIGTLDVLIGHLSFENDTLVKLDRAIADSFQIKSMVKNGCGHGIDSIFDLAVKNRIFFAMSTFFMSNLQVLISRMNRLLYRLSWF